ncbi:hypothetical protein SynA1825c_01208 [Synechococcus sp. A18-25c]|uniref:DUF3007 family protein n=1 Tax=Synechococcus sp. A18-25c TaxID=1866938 RepID=UPI000C39B8AF|nr:DUF3007 family protein [Synechococcus sp. A18-25c]MAN19012.1 hypothetical protein [Synechococcus sp. EAC657]MEC7248539.1 DUF3007 family protein [Cyanobacteriota bacterium]MEC7896608.1 DUF3007 family protein [Cyanobacteriota bacterium]QNJ19515.1 hypothetical protein SynA1825c_01208 [Synechococcus sp. A18-25c]
MTRAGVLKLGLGLLAAGGLGYWLFEALGLEGFSAGIAAEALLVVVVVVWTSSYLFRVVTGRMTYMQQRRRYRSEYDQLTAQQLQERFDALSPEEQEALMASISADPTESAAE